MYRNQNLSISQQLLFKGLSQLVCTRLMRKKLLKTCPACLLLTGMYTHIYTYAGYDEIALCPTQYLIVKMIWFENLIYTVIAFILLRF